MIFIIGGRGFVGSAFVRVCQAQGRDFAVIDRRNYGDFAGRKCSVLVNANGNSKKFLAREDPIADFDASVRSVRASLADFPCDHYVYLSSCDVYPDCSSPATTVEDLSLQVAAQSPYGFHKFLAEQCVRHAARRWLIVRFGGFVGPGMRKNPIFDILQGGPLWLDPESELQFMPTDRAAEVVLDLADMGVANEIFNVCGRGLIKIREAAEATGRSVPVRPGSPRVRYDVNVDKISALFDIPETRESVLAFIREQMARGRV